MVVPFATGGALDVVGRIVGQKMTETWGKAVIIDNRLGAGGRFVWWQPSSGSVAPSAR